MLELDQVLNADSVAIVGASKNETKRGFQTIRTLLDENYDGKIYPVNPKEATILGFPCYKKTSDIPGSVDIRAGRLRQERGSGCGGAGRWFW